MDRPPAVHAWPVTVQDSFTEQSPVPLSSSTVSGVEVTLARRASGVVRRSSAHIAR